MKPRKTSCFLKFVPAIDAIYKWYMIHMILPFFSENTCKLIQLCIGISWQYLHVLAKESLSYMLLTRKKFCKIGLLHSKKKDRGPS